MMAMPQSDDRVIGVWLRRQVAHLDETYSWPALPFNGPRFMSALQPVSFPGVEPKRSVAVFPYVSSTQDAIAGEQQVDAGFDLYFRFHHDVDGCLVCERRTHLRIVMNLHHHEK